MGWFSNRLKGIRHNLGRARDSVTSLFEEAAIIVRNPEIFGDALVNTLKDHRDGVIDFVATNPVIGVAADAGDKVWEIEKHILTDPGQALDDAYNGLADAGDWLDGYCDYFGENPGEAIGDMGLGAVKGVASTWGMVQYAGHGAWELVQEGGAQIGNIFIAIPKAAEIAYNNTLALPEDHINMEDFGITFIDNKWTGIVDAGYMENNDTNWSAWYTETFNHDAPNPEDPNYTFRKGSVVTGQIGSEFAMFAATAGAGGIVVGASKGATVGVKSAAAATRAGMAPSRIESLATIANSAARGGEKGYALLARPYAKITVKQLDTAKGLQDAVDLMYRKLFTGGKGRMTRAIELARERGFDSVKEMARHDIGPSGVRRIFMSMDGAGETAGLALAMKFTGPSLDATFAAQTGAQKMVFGNNDASAEEIMAEINGIMEERRAATATTPLGTDFASAHNNDPFEKAYSFADYKDPFEKAYAFLPAPLAPAA